MGKRKPVGKTVKCGGDGSRGCGSMFTPQGIGRHREKCSAVTEGTPNPPEPPGEVAPRRERRSEAPVTSRRNERSSGLMGGEGGLFS